MSVLCRHRTTIWIYLLTLFMMCAMNFKSYAVARDSISEHVVGVSIDKVTATGNPDTKSITINMDGIRVYDTPEVYDARSYYDFTEVETIFGRYESEWKYKDHYPQQIGWTIPQLPSNILEYQFIPSSSEPKWGWVKGVPINNYVNPKLFDDTSDSDGHEHYGRNNITGWKAFENEVKRASDLMISKGITGREAMKEVRTSSGVKTDKDTLRNRGYRLSGDYPGFNLDACASILTWLRKNNYKKFVIYGTTIQTNANNRYEWTSKPYKPSPYVVVDVATGKLSECNGNYEVTFNDYGQQVKEYSGSEKWPYRQEVLNHWKWAKPYRKNKYGSAVDKGKMSITISNIDENLTRIPITFWTECIRYYDNANKGDVYRAIYWLDVSAAIQEALNPNWKVNYNANCGAGTIAQQSIKKNQTVALSNNTMTRVGYTFKNWNTKANGSGTAYSNKQNVKDLAAPGKEITLYAQWTPRTDTKYVVKHCLMNVNGSGYTLKDTDNLKGTSDAKVTPATKTYTGFTSPAKQTVTINADGSRVVTYNYSRNKYQFTLGSDASHYSHGINTSGSTTTGSYYYGSTITLNASPKPGYSWDKWSNGNTNQRFTISMPANALTITPYANLITYQIGYVLYEGNLKKEKTVRYTVESPDIVLENPSIPGKEFLGWSDWNNSTPRIPYLIPKGTIGDLIISANWAVDKSSGSGTDSSSDNNNRFTGQSKIVSNKFNLK